MPFPAFPICSFYFIGIGIQVPIVGNLSFEIFELLWYFIISFALLIIVSSSCTILVFHNVFWNDCSSVLIVHGKWLFCMLENVNLEHVGEPRTCLHANLCVSSCSLAISFFCPHGAWAPLLLLSSCTNYSGTCVFWCTFMRETKS